jgi:hypothetical protein
MLMDNFSYLFFIFVNAIRMAACGDCRFELRLRHVASVFRPPPKSSILPHTLLQSGVNHFTIINQFPTARNSLTKSMVFHKSIQVP